MDRSKNTLAFPWRRLTTTNSTATSHASVVPTTTEPAETTAGVVNLKTRGAWCTDGAHTSDLVMIQPYGSDANNENYAMRVYGWSKLADADDSDMHGLWVPMLLVECTVTLGNIAATTLGANNFMADTVTIDKGNGALHTASSPTGDLPAYLVVDPLGSHYLQFTFDIDSSGTASASANALIRGMA